MIKFIDRYFTSSDHRGTFEGVLNQGTWAEINYITSRRNSVRGDHYHKHTREAFIILSGTVNITLQKVSGGQLEGECQSHTVVKGQVFIIEPMTNHVFSVQDSAEWINLLSHSVDQRNPDIIRL